MIVISLLLFFNETCLSFAYMIKVVNMNFEHRLYLFSSLKHILLKKVEMIVLVHLSRRYVTLSILRIELSLFKRVQENKVNFDYGGIAQ